MGHVNLNLQLAELMAVASYIYFSMCSAVVVKFGRDILRGLSDRDIVVDHRDT
jgi:hypothetical protein|tara:strand:- start:24683 stop:24841 length:159 start_codon:yes stop_codon:yes gene_type:complete